MIQLLRFSGYKAPDVHRISLIMFLLKASSSSRCVALQHLQHASKEMLLWLCNSTSVLEHVGMFWNANNLDDHDAVVSLPVWVASLKSPPEAPFRSFCHVTESDTMNTLEERPSETCVIILMIHRVGKWHEKKKRPVGRGSFWNFEEWPLRY